jgi:hypothetical protein
LRVEEKMRDFFTAHFDRIDKSKVKEQRQHVIYIAK